MALIDETLAQMRAELEAAIVTLDPLLVGLRNFQRLKLSDEARNEIDKVLSDHDHRRSNIVTVLGALAAVEQAIDTLSATNYPTLNKEPVSAAVRAELDALLASLASAEGELLVEGQAAVATINLGSPQPKSKGK